MPHRDKKAKPKKIKLLLFLLFIIAAFAAGYVYTLEDSKETPPKVVRDAEFMTVENPDSTKYKTVVSPLNHVEILTVSRIFYGDEAYWSYILQANPEIDNLLNIPTGAVIKIPKIDSLGTENSLAKAKLLGDKLLSSLNKETK